MSDGDGFRVDHRNDNRGSAQAGAQRGGSFEDDVDDPAALRRAEEEVAHWETPFDGPRKPPIDEAWSVVATQDAAGDYAGLDDVARALDADGVDFGWDPYDPRQTVNFLLPDAGLTARKLFSIVVPVSQFEAAQVTLYGLPPQGVTYAWDAGIPAAGHRSGPQPPVAMGDGPDFAPSGPARPPVASGDPRISDNRRLEDMAGRDPRTGAYIAAVMVVLVAIGVIAFLLARG